MSGRGPGLAPVVCVALVVCYVGGRAELWSRHHSAHVPRVLELAAPVVFGVVVAGVVVAFVCLRWFVRHGRWIPGRYRAPKAGPGPRPAVGPLEASGGIVEWYAATIGPSVPLNEAEGAPGLPNYAAGNVETDTLFSDPGREMADNSAA